MDNLSPDERAPRAVWNPDPRLTALTAVLTVAAAGAAAVAPDRAGTLLLALAALVLAAYTAGDLVYRPRLEVDADGLTVNSPWSRARLLWRDLDAVRADVRSRHGLRSVTLEIDTGDRLVVLSRRALGADPEQVAEVVRAFAH